MEHHPPSSVPSTSAPQADQASSTIPIAAFLERLTPRAWVTPLLVALIVIGFAVEVALHVSPIKPTVPELLKAGGDFGPAVIDGEWWRIFTSLFVHAGLLHLACNLWAFWSIGRFSERIFGNLAFLAIYMLSGVGGALASLSVHPLTVCVGASGAIFGVYGATLAFVLTHKGVFPEAFLQKQRNSLLGFVGYNIFFSLRVPNIDLSAHGGGFMTGLLVGALLSRDLAKPAAHVARRVVSALAVAVGLAFVFFGVERHIARVPAISYDRLTRDAKKSFDEGNFAKTLDLYTQAIAIPLEREDDPEVRVNRGAVRANRGLAYAQLDQYALALADFRAADSLHPAARTASLICQTGADLANTSEERTAAVGWCSDAVTRDPRDAQPLAWRALLHEQMLETTISLADADAALGLDPENRLAIAVRLDDLVTMKSWDAAERDCVARLKESAPGVAIVRGCARVARERGDGALARQRVDRAIELDPSGGDTRLSRALLLEWEGHLAEARTDFLAAVAAIPDLHMAWNHLAWIELETQDYANARAHADHAIALDPDDASSRGARGIAHAALGEAQAARDDCAFALSRNPNDNLYRGLLAFLDGRWTEARRSWTLASRNPANARLLAPWIAKLPKG